MTSCLTLAGVVKLKAEDAASAAQLARALPFVGRGRSGDDGTDARGLGEAIGRLVGELGLERRLAEYGVGEEEAERIAGTVVGGREGEGYARVVGLVRSLF